MTEHAKPTPGPVTVEDEGYLDYLDGAMARYSVRRVGDDPICYVVSDNDAADASLIADAFNVHHETGLTPRELWENVQSKDHIIMDQGQQIHHLHEQLAEQNRHLAELLEIADAAVRALASDICNLVPDEDLQRWQAAIAKALESLEAAMKRDIGAGYAGVALAQVTRAEIKGVLSDD